MRALFPFFLIALPTLVLGAFNDSGQSQCFDGVMLTECSEANTGDASLFPRQDGRFGRDARASLGLLAKAGAGAGGFDFTRVCNSGQAAGTGSCPANPVLGPGPNDWACTRDNTTGLLWEMKTAANSGDTFASLSAAEAYAGSVNANALCGFSGGWRVPARRELLSIVHYGTSDPAIDTSFFPHTAGGLHWASDAPGVFFENGVAPVNVLTTDDPHVRVVRGPGLPEHDFVDNGDGTVTDHATGLVWDRCSWGQTWNPVGNDCTGPADGLDWAAGLFAAVTANENQHRGYDDWRVPNATELESLVDLGASAPAIDTGFFPGVGSADYWTSTVFFPDTSRALGVVFFDGGLVQLNRVGSLRVLLVRGGSSFDALRCEPSLLDVVGVTLPGMLDCLYERVLFSREQGVTDFCTKVAPLFEEWGPQVGFVLEAFCADTPAIISDSRLKEDIVMTGVTDSGLPLYRFRYQGGRRVYEGVLAQDVLERDPQAVRELSGGYLAVDYGRLGLALRRVSLH